MFPPVDQRHIYNPVMLQYVKIIGETEKGLGLQFKNESEHWFSKALSRFDKQRCLVITPKNFAKQRGLLEYEVKNEQR